MTNRTWNYILIGLWSLLLIAWLWSVNWRAEVLRIHVDESLTGQLVSVFGWISQQIDA